MIAHSVSQTPTHPSATNVTMHIIANRFKSGIRDSSPVVHMTQRGLFLTSLPIPVRSPRRAGGPSPGCFTLAFEHPG
jgi:hypothetical protein